MDTDERDESPLEAAAGAGGEQAVEAFALLGNETRLAILLALWEAYEPFEDDDAVSFTELRRRVGVRDSGQFHYHLDKLEGEFVESTDDGYQLRTAGHRIVQAVVAGVGTEEPTFEHEESSVRCPRCETPIDFRYEHQKIQGFCSECSDESAPDDEEGPGRKIMQTTFDPGGVVDRTPEAAILANAIQQVWKNAMRIGGVCPECSGPVSSSFAICEDHDTAEGETCPDCGFAKQIMIRMVCTLCKGSMEAPPGGVAQLHPEAQRLYADRGFGNGFGAGDFESIEEMNELEQEIEGTQELVSVEPLRVRVALTDGDRTTTLLFNEDVEVVEAEYSRGSE